MLDFRGDQKPKNSCSVFVSLFGGPCGSFWDNFCFRVASVLRSFESLFGVFSEMFGDVSDCC